MTDLDLPPAPPAPPRRPRRNVVPLLLFVAVMIVGVGVAGFGVLRWMDYSRNVVASGTMEPTFAASTVVISRAVGDGEIHRGDIVTFPAGAMADKEGTRLSLFRVIAVGGDSVMCCDPGKHIVVNKKPVTEPYLNTGKDADSPLAHQPFVLKVPQGTVFVAGDNRGNSNDSRFHVEGDRVGAVAVSQITGIVVATGSLLDPHVLTPTTAFTDAGLAGEPLHDNGYATIRWLIGGGLAVFVIGLIGAIVCAARSGGTRRTAAAVPPAH